MRKLVEMNHTCLRQQRLMVGSFLLPIILLSLSGTASGQTRAASLSEEVAKIERAYNIEIVTTAIPFPVQSLYGVTNGKNADKEEVERYLNLFIPEFTLYPASFVKLSLLKRIVICKELSFAGQLRNAVPDWEHDTLYLEASRGLYSKAYMRKVIHHEYFHVIDYRDDGSLYKDEIWSSLNAPGFKYGSGGLNAQGLSYSSLLTDKFPGFLNYYSTTGVEEDKAELFANLIVDPAYVENRIKNDSVLASKVKQMMKLLNTFCPDLNDKFWKKVRSMDRTAG